MDSPQHQEVVEEVSSQESENEWPKEEKTALLKPVVNELEKLGYFKPRL